MALNAQNAATAPDAVDQGIGGQVDATPDQVAGTSDDGSNVGIDKAEEERIAGERTERASRAALASWYKQQGLTPEEAAQAFETYKAGRETKKAEERNNLGLLQQQNTELEAKATQAIETANKRLITAEAKLQAASLGVKSDRVDFVVRLAELHKVTIDENGTVDQAAARQAIEEILKQVPELKQTEENRAGFKIGGSGQDNQQSTSDKIAEIFGNKKKEK